MLQAIRSWVPEILLKLFQRRLLDKTAEVTTEELIQAHYEIVDQIKMLEFRLDVLKDKQKMLLRLIKQDDLNDNVHVSYMENV